MKKLGIRLGLLALALTSCSRAPTLLVNVENLPGSARSLQVIATHANLAALVDLEPYDLQLPVKSPTTLLLRLPASFSGDVAVNIGAFKDAGGQGCLVGTGVASQAEFVGPDGSLRVPITPTTDTACTVTSTKKVSITAIEPGLAKMPGGESLSIRGWGFKPGAKVQFGATAARSVTYKSAFELVAETPAKAGFGLTAVRVTNTDGAFDERRDLLRYYGDPLDVTGLPFDNNQDPNAFGAFTFGAFNPSVAVSAAITMKVDNKVRLIFSDGSTKATSEDYPNVGMTPTGLVSGDFNGDGSPDLAVTSTGDNTLHIMLNDAKGKFTVGAPVPIGKGAEVVVTADLNGDKSPDLVVANRIDNSLTVLINDGKANFPNPQTILGVKDPISIALGDLTGDNLPDIAIANNLGSKISVLTNLGGRFDNTSGVGSTTLDITSDGKPTAVQVGDVDHDGRKDVLLSISDANKVLVLLNQGLPVISKYNLATEGGPLSLSLYDLNGDGFDDLVVPCNTSNTVDLFLSKPVEGLRGVTFNSQPAQCIGPKEVAIFDVGFDGRPDIAVLGSMGLGLLLNNTGR